MKIGTVIRNKQPDVLEQLHRSDYENKHRRGKKERLSFSYTEDLMSHDSFVRHNGAIKQSRWSK